MSFFGRPLPWNVTGDAVGAIRENVFNKLVYVTTFAFFFVCFFEVFVDLHELLLGHTFHVVLHAFRVINFHSFFLQNLVT